MTKIYLIRHAEAEGNLYRRIQGHWDGSITPLGLQQIDALAQRFRREHIDALYCSDLSRARATALFLHGSGPLVRARLRADPCGAKAHGPRH